MKKLLLLFFVSAMFIGCNTNPNYEANLATAQKLFELHGEEKLDEQLALVSKDMEIITPMYDSEPGNYDTYAAMLKGYQDTYEDIKYTATVWLPGSNPEGKLDGSVRTYGTWTGKNSITGKDLNLTPRGRIVAGSILASDPVIMLAGPGPAAKKCLKTAGLTPNDIDLWEINEAFASVALRYMKDLDIDHAITNVNGGSIAMGHPLGATGAMLVSTMLDELERRQLKRAMLSLCVGGGMGISCLIERV